MVGFRPVGLEWPSSYYHEELRLYVVICVDEVNRSGPSTIKQGWCLFRQGTPIEQAHHSGLSGVVHLDCNQERYVARLPYGVMSSVMSDDVDDLPAS